MDHVGDTESAPELYFSDDARMICEMLEKDWPDTPGEPHPAFIYDRERFIADSRFGSVFVYLVSSPVTIADTDYRTVDKTPRLALKLSCRSRDLCMKWVRILDSILMSRRRSMRRFGPYTFLEVSNIRPDNSADGWYSFTFDIKLTGFHIPVRGSGLYKPDCGCEYHDSNEGGF